VVIRTVSEPPVLLYDGLCGFCNGWVKLILERDKVGTVRFAALQGSYAADVAKRHPSIQGMDSIVLVVEDDECEKIAVRSDAVLEIARYLGGLWHLVGVLRLVPRSVRDWAYDVIAKNRYRWFGRYDSCPVPDAAVRDRFLP